MTLRLVIPILLSTLLIQSCSSFSVKSRNENADNLAAQAGWIRETLHTRDFDLRSYHSSRRPQNKLTIYIEGDGLAWVSRTRPSLDPTPINPLALKLALKDSGNVAYLGRPCQYIASPTCRQADWTSSRFSPEIVASMNQAVDQLKQQMHAQQLTLVGYSGGGNIAALLAARRHDVARLVTVAGNLDYQTWTRLLNISPLTGSLNAANVWQDLINTPQLHLVGGADKTIPITVAKAFQSRFPEGHKPGIRVVPGFDHHCCWTKQWPQLMQ